MPAFYTHYRFGRELIPALPADIRRSVGRFPQLFHAGLQGPDFFFYYNPLFKTAIGALGSAFHHQSGVTFFTHAARAADTEAAQVYLYGLLAHYALDSACHPFIHAHTDEGPIFHVELESEFERFLMETDGKTPPKTQDRSRYMKLTRGECVTVAAFYPPAAPGHINRAVKNTAWCLKMLAVPDGVRRKIVSGALHLAGGQMPHHLLPGEPNPTCSHLNEALLELYNGALERYPILLEQLLGHMKEDTPLGAEFEPEFG